VLVHRVHVIVFTGLSSKSLVYRIDHASVLICSSRGLPLACFRKPQQTFEKHLLEPFCWELSFAGSSYKTDSSHVERCKICSQASLHVPLVALISRATVLNDHSTHCNHQSCVEALSLAMIFDTSFRNARVTVVVCPGQQSPHSLRPTQCRNISK
jgi:hypothetical protein